MAGRNDPQALVARYFEHLQAEEWMEAARLLDPTYLRYFRETEAPRASPSSAPSVEAYLEQDPNLPREVAEYWVLQSSRYPPPSIGDSFAGVESAEGLAGLGDADLFARHLEAADHETQARRHLAALAVQHPEFDEQLKTMLNQTRGQWRFEMIGSVVTNERSYVLFEPPRAREGVVQGYEPIPHVAVVVKRVDGLRIAHDPSPYSGMGRLYPPVTVVDSNGETVELQLRQNESA